MLLEICGGSWINFISLGKVHLNELRMWFDSDAP
jgi:hypothetical protein